MTTAVADLLRELVPQVLGILVRRHGQFETCEDVVQEALLEAAVRWPEQGVPDNPRAWLLTVASRRLTDHWRSEQARRRREVAVASLQPLSPDPDPDSDIDPDADDTLALLFLCCHPALPEPSQLALTLRAVGGLTTAEIARAFLVPEPTMAQRISRAKQRIRAAGSTFAMPPAEQLADRLRVVLRVLYLIFNEGYTASSGPQLHRTELTAEAIRLTRIVHRLRPDDGEVAGLLALMLLTDARRATRTTADGALVPIAEQDRGRWDREAIAEGVALVSGALADPRPARTSCRQPSRRCTWRRRGPRTPTGRRSWSCTGCWPGSTRARWCGSTRRSRWPWSPARGPGWSCWTRWPPTTGWPSTTGWPRCGPTCSNSPVTRDGAREQYLLAARRATSLPEQRYLRAREARLRR